jgi:protein-disulfide isomerase
LSLRLEIYVALNISGQDRIIMKRTVAIATVVGAALIAIAIVAGITISNSAGGDDTSQEQQAVDSRLSFSSLASTGSPVRGDESAPITIVEFSDFQCPNCGRFARNTAPQIVEEYIATGQVNMVYKHFPIRGPDSMAASLASQCAGDQGKFWEFHDMLFNNQEGEGSGWASAENMKGFASELGLDREKFDLCLDSEKYRSLVEGDLAFGQEIGVTGTPSFVIVYSDGSEPEGVLGAQPFSSFKAVLDTKIDS